MVHKPTMNGKPTFTVTCLHGTGNGGLGQFVWSAREDIVKGFPRKDILCKLPQPVTISNRHFGWMNNDIKHIDALMLMFIFPCVF